MKTILLMLLMPSIAFATIDGNRQSAINSWGTPVWQKGNLALFVVQGTYIEETYDLDGICQSIVFVRTNPFSTDLVNTLDQLVLPKDVTWAELPSTNPEYKGWRINNGSYYVTAFKAVFQ